MAVQPGHRWCRLGQTAAMQAGLELPWQLLSTAYKQWATSLLPVEAPKKHRGKAGGSCRCLRAQSWATSRRLASRGMLNTLPLQEHGQKGDTGLGACTQVTWGYVRR